MGKQRYSKKMKLFNQKSLCNCLSEIFNYFWFSNQTPMTKTCLLFYFQLLTGIAYSQIIDASKYIATIRFDNVYQDFFRHKHEQQFPICYTFNTTQDANVDGVITVEDACENIVPFAIGDSIYGKGRTGLTNRGPNNQHPALYFHYTTYENYSVYEYWLYYADNDYLNDHEHDWEKYFVYELENKPVYVALSHHKKIHFYKWEELLKDENHIIIGVKGGSHALTIQNKKGVEIRFDGTISKNKGYLEQGDKETLPWRIYSNDEHLKGVLYFAQQPDCFYNGDPVYKNIPKLSCKKELENCSKAPWLREEWNKPPLPY